MVVGILGWGVFDEVEDLHCNLLRHGLHAVVKFSLTAGHSLKSELGLRLNDPSFNVFWPERSQLHSKGIEEVCVDESGGNSFKNSRISSHAEKQKETPSN